MCSAFWRDIRGENETESEGLISHLVDKSKQFNDELCHRWNSCWQSCVSALSVLCELDQFRLLGSLLEIRHVFLMDL